jgi:hypothetical protein
VERTTKQAIHVKLKKVSPSICGFDVLNLPSLVREAAAAASE